MESIAYLRRNYDKWDIFIDPKKSYNFMLTNAQKWKLKIINSKISKYINKKAGGNTVMQNKYRNNLKMQLNKMINKAKTNKRKTQLTYIMDNI